ncbi:YjcQ family protein [Ligilactobacillus ceti]|uniref:YjcQ family protein n=1 Tax=Ligilactobacillus ceti TaxID=395085 RepID=UPI000489169F|nr:YjcQ family protein [Ligilactobacillus ceti]
MSNKDFFAVTYKILSYLKYCYENDLEVDRNVFKGSTFGVSDKQFIKTLVYLRRDGIIKSANFDKIRPWERMAFVDSVELTVKGFEYLKENSMMRKAYKIFKEFREWAPF